MRVMVFSTADESQMGGLGEPTPELVAAFKAMDDFTEELVKAGVFVAAAGLKPSAQSKRIEFDGRSSRGKVIDGPFAESRELVVGFSIWEVKDMDEAMAWAMKAPVMPGMSGAMEIRPFYEVADLGAFVSPEELAGGGRSGERGKLGVA
ncbi:MAG TPA: YciI family protein [Rhizomicrobium sp.]